MKGSETSAIETHDITHTHGNSPSNTKTHKLSHTQKYALKQRLEGVTEKVFGQRETGEFCRIRSVGGS